MTIGPGALVLVVGPSGVGKDTVIALARAQCSGHPGVMFPRRIVTRPSSAAEDHDSLTMAEFEDGICDGAFSFWWDAHGHRYALPQSVNNHVRRGHAVVCNVSRGMVGPLRQRYARVVAVLVTAPPDILAARLSARGRASDGSVAARIDRSAPTNAELKPDVTIDNSGSAAAAAACLMQVLRGVAPA